MKTLKKTLCLVLAMVMVFGLCAVSASAKLEYTDNNDINYAEAVDVLSGIGILAGDARGFRPGDPITRAEAAKIIAYITIGNATQADSLKATSAPFDDVPVSHWASGYISYCATSGIIAGKGDGYHPGENVTGLEFAAMLLRALGYGKQNEYIGTDWAINTSKDALRLGIFNGNLAGASNDAATREECALYAFNTIAAANDLESETTSTGIKSGIKKVSYSSLLGGYIESALTAQNPDANKNATFGEDFGLKCELADDDVFGRIAGHHWTQKTGNNTRIISGDYDDDQRLLAVYTTAVTSGDIYKLIVDRFGKSFLDDVVKSVDCTENSHTHSNSDTTHGKFEFYLNDERDMGDDDTGASGSYDTKVNINPHDFVKGDTKTLAYTGNGVQTYVYAWTQLENGEPVDHLRICIVDTYLAKVDKVVEAKGGREPETTVRLVKSYENSITTDIKYSVATEDFEEGDYVLVTITTSKANGTLGDNLNSSTATLGTVVDIEAAPTLETEVTKYIKKGTSKTLEIGSKTYVTAKNTAGDDSTNVTDEDIDTAAIVDNKIVDGDTHILYLDKYGYLIATSDIAEVSNYAYVAQFGMKTNDATTLNDEAVLRAHVYFADGTDKVLTVDAKAGIFNDTDKAVNMTASFNGAADLKADKVIYGTAVDSATDPTDATDEDNIARIGVYRVSVDKNTVTLHEKYTTANVVPSSTNGHEIYDSGSPKAGDDTNVTYVTKGNANIFGADADAKGIANGSTVFFYVFGNYGNKNFKVTVYNGINDVPTVKRSERLKAELVNYIQKDVTSGGTTSHIIKAAYVDDDLTETESNDVVYFFGGTADTANFDKSKDGWTVRYYVYGGDDNGYLSIKYDSAKKADEDIAEHPNAGFVKVEDGKLKYVAEKNCTHGTPDKIADDLDKVTYTTEATITLVSGDRRDTLKVSYIDKDNGKQENIYMPLYKVEENKFVFDLRTEALQSATKGEVDSLNDLFTALINGDVTHFNAAVSIEGTESGTETNVLTGIYILGQNDALPTP